MTNKTLATHTRLTVGKVTAIRLQLDAPSEITGTGAAMMADGQDVALIRATLVDARGLHVNSAADSVTFRVVSGGGRVVGTHNGDPTTHENNHAPTHAAYHGLVRCVVMSTVDASSPAWHRARLQQIDVDSDHGMTRIVGPHDAFANDDIIVEASAPGLPSARIHVPVSTSPADSVLAVAERSAKPVVV